MANWNQMGNQYQPVNSPFQTNNSFQPDANRFQTSNSFQPQVSPFQTSNLYQPESSPFPFQMSNVFPQRPCPVHTSNSFQPEASLFQTSNSIQPEAYPFQTSNSFPQEYNPYPFNMSNLFQQLPSLSQMDNHLQPMGYPFPMINPFQPWNSGGSYMLKSVDKKEVNENTDSQSDDEEAIKGVTPTMARQIAKLSNATSKGAVEVHSYKKGKSKGYTLLFFNEKFKKKEMCMDLGSQPDILRTLFEEIGFSVRIFKDHSVTSMKRKIHRYAKREISCFVCFITSHGSNGKIIDRHDETIHLEELYKAADTANLQGIPKCFFISACRGGPKDSYRPNNGTSQNLIAYASLSGTPSYYHAGKGCVFFDYFIKHLKDSLTKAPSSINLEKPELVYRRDVEYILKKVMADMAEKKDNSWVTYSNSIKTVLFFRKDV